MTEHRKTLLWVAGGLGLILLVLLLTLTVLAPRLINLESLKGQIQAEFSKAVGGDLDFERLEFSFLPRPGVVVQRATFSIPETGQGRLKSTKVCPAILPLLKGRLHIAKVQLEEPDFELRLPKMPGREKEEPRTVPSRSIEDKAASLLSTLAVKVPNLEIELQKGKLDLVDDKGIILSLRDVDAGMVLPPSGPEIRITCGSNSWESFSVEGSLDEETLTGDGKIEISQFQPQLLTRYFFPDTTVRFSESIANLRADLHTDGLRKSYGEVKATVPLLTLSRDGEEAALEGTTVEATFHFDEQETALYVKKLDLDHPRLRMTGKFMMDQAAPEARLELAVKELDVGSTREVALALGGRVPVVQKIFDIVRGGEIPLITFHTNGRSINELGKIENIHIHGGMRSGTIYIRKPDLNLEGVKGEVLISKGLLEGKNLEGHLANSRGLDGTLSVGLKGRDAPFHLDIRMEADLAQLPPLLKRLVRSEPFVRELSLVSSLEGTAEGKLVLGESLRSIDANVEISQCSLAARYQRIPHLVRIDEGEFSYARDRIGAKNLIGSLGESSFSDLSFELDFEETPHLVVQSGKSSLSLDEVYRWLASYETLEDDLGAFKEVKGAVEITGLTLEGPLLKPADCRFEASGSLKNLAVNTTFCPGPMGVTSGSFRATSEELSFTNLEQYILDTPLRVSGLVKGYLQGTPRIELNMTGEMGPEAAGWISEIIHLPHELKVRSPFSFRDARLVWSDDEGTSFNGDFTFPGGLDVSLDVLQNPQGITVKQISIEDQESRTTLSLDLKSTAFGLKFTGTLTGTTLERILVNGLNPKAHLKGDMLVHIQVDQPEYSKAQGYLEGRNLVAPLEWLAPFKIDRLSLEATETGVDITSALLTWEDSHISLDGNMGFSSNGLLFEMDLAADGIEWDSLQKTIDKMDGQKAVDQDESSWRLPVKGTVRCTSEYFTYGPFTWRPVQASVTFAQDSVRVAVTDANLCGVSTLGALNVIGQEVSLDFKLVSKDQKLEPTIPCFSESERRVTGTFDLIGEVTGKGKGDELLRALRGNMELSARDGQIYRDRLLAKVFSFLNVTEVLRGKIPDLMTSELAYDSMTLKATLQDGDLLLEEWILDGPTMGIVGHGSIDLVDEKLDVELLVAPLRTIDFIIEKTPVIKRITGGALLTIPLEATGDWEDPEMRLLTPSSVGSRLLGIMKNTLTLPIEIVEPVMPGGSKNGP